MKKDKKQEELQSRRQFFKKAAKGALPILGAIALSQIPLLGKAKEISDCQFGCSGGCQGSCFGGCQGQCTNSCANACGGNCSGRCYNTCYGTCSGGCARSQYA